MRGALSSRPSALRYAAVVPILATALAVPTARLGEAADRFAVPAPAAAMGIAPPLRRVGFLDYSKNGLIPADAVAARTANARIGFAQVPLRVAPPFFLPNAVSLSDSERATDCLAAAAYYEAGDDPRGQRAVMQVVLNRLRNPAYPHSVCGVVFHGAERRTGCQFTFTCDGALARYRPSPAAWQRARGQAAGALGGAVDATVGHATHYHTDWVHPYWSATLDKIAVVDTHLFFQARALRPGNFSASYAGAEPLVARIAWLSDAHRSAEVPAEAASEAVTVATEAAIVPSAPMPAPTSWIGPPLERLPDRAEAPREDMFLVMLDVAADPEGFRRLAQARCAGLRQCKFIGWVDPARYANRFPLSGAAIDAIAFSFSRTGNGAADQVRWDCRLFPRNADGECLKGRGGQRPAPAA